MDAKKLLKLVQNGIISLEDLSEAFKEADMTKKISEIHKNKISQLKDGRYRTYLYFDGKEKQIVASTKEKLYEKLCEWYGLSNSDTVKDIFDKWVEYRKDNTQTKENTIRRDKYYYRKFFAESKISQKRIIDLKQRDWQVFFDNVSKLEVTKKEMSAIKSIANGIYSHAYFLEYDVVNYIHRVDFKKYRYKVKADVMNEVFTHEEAKKLLEYLLALKTKDAHDYAILLLFQVCARIGEVKALRWTDVEEGYIKLCGQYLEDGQGYVPYIKGQTEQGFRTFKQTVIAKRVLFELRQFNGDKEFIFTYDGHVILTDTVNKRLKRYCNQLKIRYFSSHKIRFYTATLMAEQGLSLLDLRDTLGHTTTTMSEHYIRCIADKKRICTVSEILESNSPFVLDDVLGL